MLFDDLFVIMPRNPAIKKLSNFSAMFFGSIVVYPAIVGSVKSTLMLDAGLEFD